MSECKDFKKTYFNYRCYTKLKKYYQNLNETETAKEFLQEHKVPLEIEKYFMSTPKFFHKLGDYLASYGPYDTYKNITCLYINYLINVQIEDKHGFDDIKYKYFLDFADGIAKKMSRALYHKNTCSGYFSYLKDNTNYPVMKALYNIYDLFTKIKEPYTLTEDQKCSNFRSIDLYYKELIRQNQNDLELHDKLLDFRKIVLNERDNHKVPCGSSISYIMPEQESILPKRSPANSAVEGEKLLSKDPPKSSAANELEPEVPVSTHPPKPESRREEDISELKKQAEESLTTEETSLGGHSGEHVEGEQQEDTSFPNGRHNEHSHLREFQRKQLPQAFPRNERLDEMNGHIDGINYQSQDSYIPPSQQEGFMDSIKGTFAGIVQSVDPGPVLGVSGGMGALFILFKYTPVGSFFGGRRRRIHQIPSSFRGLSPGEFPIFQEHDVGYIGYGAMNTSLAE
ncbi:VIR protein [Plasmodium vivax]|uniref:VIR protein n=1 Tax=Plasmodium vivax TaxID=5855 RepID=A0A1G4E9L1_PLAVI|nr:VIR protein [Plasmodium vivax]